ncbi:hypothetical protein ACJJTC_011038 [Scirpophaga incertulas]
MVFSRHPDVLYPKVWHKFTIQRGSSSVTLRVQDLTEDLFEPAVQMLLAYFTRDEPPCRCVDINKYPSAVAELEKLWRKTLKDKLSLACVEDKEGGQLVGVNVLTVVSKEDKDEEFHTEDKVWASLFGAVDFVSRAVDVYQHYGVDQYLTAYGLVVPPSWRGCKIGKEILLARIPLCKALGIKATVTVFTASASQAVAMKAGFEVIYQISYEELAKKGFIFPNIEKDTKYSKLMGLAID